MGTVNLHVVLNAAGHPSRILKETASLVQSGIAERVVVAALHEHDLPEVQRIDADRRIVRPVQAAPRIPSEVAAAPPASGG